MRKAITYLKNVDKHLSKVIDRIGNLDTSTYNNDTDSFCFLVREIVGQMISSNVKKVIWGRLIDICNNQITPQNIDSLSTEQLRSIGLSTSKSNYIKGLASLVKKGDFNFNNLKYLSDAEIMKQLTSIRGIGNWTAKMYLIFFLQREDVLPYEDGAFLQAYKWLYNTNNTKPISIKRRCKKWKPYSSIGARYMYRALDTGLTSIPVKTFLANSKYEDDEERPLAAVP